MFGLKNLFKGGGDDKNSSTKKTTPPTNPNQKKIGSSIGSKSGGISIAIKPQFEKGEPPTLGRKTTNSPSEPMLPKLNQNALQLNLNKDENQEESSANKSPLIQAPKKIDSLLEQTVTVEATSPIEEEIATVFSEGDDDSSISIIKNYFKQNNGKVEKRIWFMLLDIYQIKNDKEEFDKAALAFAQEFGTSPPSWFGKENTDDKKDAMNGGKNMIILEPILKPEYAEKFKELFKSAKKENFCRINVSQCKFEQNSPEMLEKFLKLLWDLRKAKVVSVLMGDNNLIAFCKKAITGSDSLPVIFEENEQLLWLIYLELLQWKGLQEEFENLALEFAEKFEISPPGWDDKGVMELSNANKQTKDENNSNKKLVLDRDINGNNLEPLLNFIQVAFEKGTNAEIDMTSINRIDFGAAGTISFHIQELWSNPSFANKKVIFKYPNELIIILLHMVGATEFVYIVPRNRK